MHSTIINLGRCALHDIKWNKVSLWLDTISDFGIPLKELDKLDLNIDETFNIYQHIVFYRKSVRFLKSLRVKIDNDTY